ncbi:MAG: hypothetical protein WKG03_17395 [Telluria sp.]
MVETAAARSKAKRVRRNYICISDLFSFKFDLHHGQQAITPAKIHSPGANWHVLCVPVPPTQQRVPAKPPRPAKSLNWIKFKDAYILQLLKDVTSVVRQTD